MKIVPPNFHFYKAAEIATAEGETIQNIAFKVTSDDVFFTV